MIDTFDSASLACGNGTASAARRTPGLAGLGLAIHAAPHHSWAGETPWHVVANDDALELRVGRRRKEAQSDADCASVLMGCGAALENMRIALNHAGFLPDVALFPDVADADLVAILRAGVARTAGREEEALFTTISEQGSGRLGLEAAAPRTTSALLALLHHAARTRGGWIEVIADDGRRALLADLVAQTTTLSDAARGSRPLFSPFASGMAQPSTPGTPDLLGQEHLFGALGAWVRPTGPQGRLPRAWDGARIMEAPIVFVLASPGDTPAALVNAGAALQRVLLHATAQRMAATLFGEPLQHALVRDQLAAMLYAGGHVHGIVRLDFAATDA